MFTESQRMEINQLIDKRDREIRAMIDGFGGADEAIAVAASIQAIGVALDDGAYLPQRAHATDAGADIRTPEEFTLKAHSSWQIATGVHVQLPPNTVGMLKSKSGLNVKHGIVSEGVIDEGFSGEIIVKLYNHSDRDYVFQKGDKITQLVVMPVCYVDYMQVEAIKGGERGSNGYGSTGR